MINCPHCNKPSISRWEKYCASTSDPFICRRCDKPCSMPGFVESASALLYFFAVFVALNVFAFTVMDHRSSGEANGPTPGAILIALLVFSVAVEFAKAYLVPLKALSDGYVDGRKTTATKVNVVVVGVVLAALLLGKCGF